MSTKVRTFFLLSFVFCLSFCLTSCSPKYGCPVNESVHVKPNRKGQLPSRSGKTGLFPKEVQKKGKVRG